GDDAGGGTTIGSEGTFSYFKYLFFRILIGYCGEPHTDCFPTGRKPGNRRTLFTGHGRKEASVRRIWEISENSRLIRYVVCICKSVDRKSTRLNSSHVK